jgi:hypothetical protein
MTNTFTTQYRFVTIPPGDSREKLRKGKPELATQALLEAEAEERKQVEVHPTKRQKQESPLVSDARATLLAVDAPPPQELCTTVRIKYRQTEVLTCLIDSFLQCHIGVWFVRRRGRPSAGAPDEVESEQLSVLDCRLD